MADVDGLLKVVHAVHPVAGQRLQAFEAQLAAWRDAGVHGRGAALDETAWEHLLRVKDLAQKSISEDPDDYMHVPSSFMSLERFLELPEDKVDEVAIRTMLLHAFNCNRWFTFNGHMLDVETKQVTDGKEYLAPNFNLATIPYVYMAVPVSLP